MVAGDGLTLTTMTGMREKFSASPAFVRPSYAFQFWNIDVQGLISQVLCVHEESVQVAAASASGNQGLITGARLVAAGAVDVCLVVAAVQDLGPVELMGFANLGALADPADDPAESGSRPFDVGHRGFVYGQGAAALVVETVEHAERRGVAPLAFFLGGAGVLDGNRLTDPSLAGEVRAMTTALRRAGVAAEDVDLVNAHATGMPLGDATEAQAIGTVFGGAKGPWVNNTKALLGHTLGAASALEAVACILQLRSGYVHSARNLIRPIAPLRFGAQAEVSAHLRIACNNAFGFGGIDTAVILMGAV